MRPALPRSPRRSAARAAALGAIALAACHLQGRPTPRERNEEINRALLGRLLEGDALTPVADFDEDAYFAELEELYADARPAPAEPLPVDPSAPPGPINPFLEFGQRIWVDETTGIVTKPYTFPLGMGQQMLDLLLVYGDFEIQATALEGVIGAGEEARALPALSEQRPEAAILDLYPGFDSEAFTPPRVPLLAATQIVPLSDVIFVRARPEVLFEVEYSIDFFAADARQIEIEAKIVEVRTTDSLDIGIRPVDSDTPIFGLPSSGTLINSIDYAFPNTVSGGEALFGLSSVFDGVEFNALLEMVAVHENVQIISRPKVAVREGAQADIVNITTIPFFKIQGINAQGSFKTTIEEQEIGVQMYIIPRIVGDDTIILNIDIEVSQETGTAATFVQGSGRDATVLTVPEISTQAARTIVRLEPGEAVILGGLISERNVERESGILFLKDIPLLGFLFRSRFTEQEQTNVLFFIRPRILQGIDVNPDF